MDYVRRKRNVTYFSASCKMYLRHDFKHTCAYCGILENIISPFPEIAEKYFEKDHFLPQKDNFEELHQYQNLFYACQKCNGKKDAIILPLNPCVNDIYRGATPHIYGGGPETDYWVQSSSEEGNKYIELLELNSRYHVAIRRKQQECLQANNEAKKILDELLEKKKLDKETLQKIAKAFSFTDDWESMNYLCGCSEFGTYCIDTYDHLIKRGYECEIILEDNELDMKVIIEGIQYWVKLLEFRDTEQCRIKISILQEWKKLDIPCGVLRYLPSKQVARFYRIDFNDINWSNMIYCTTDYIEL